MAPPKETPRTSTWVWASAVMTPVGEHLPFQWLPPPTVVTQARDEQQRPFMAADRDRDGEAVDVQDVVVGCEQPGPGLHPRVANPVSRPSRREG